VREKYDPKKRPPKRHDIITRLNNVALILLRKNSYHGRYYRERTGKAQVYGLLDAVKKIKGNGDEDYLLFWEFDSGWWRYVPLKSVVEVVPVHPLTRDDLSLLRVKLKRKRSRGQEKVNLPSLLIEQGMMTVEEMEEIPGLLPEKKIDKLMGLPVLEALEEPRREELTVVRKAQMTAHDDDEKTVLAEEEFRSDESFGENEDSVVTSEEPIERPPLPKELHPDFKPKWLTPTYYKGLDIDEFRIVIGKEFKHLRTSHERSKKWGLCGLRIHPPVDEMYEKVQAGELPLDGWYEKLEKEWLVVQRGERGYWEKWGWKKEDYDPKKYLLKRLKRDRL
jgi:hypothetical protein